MESALRFGIEIYINRLSSLFIKILLTLPQHGHPQALFHPIHPEQVFHRLPHRCRFSITDVPRHETPSTHGVNNGAGELSVCFAQHFYVADRAVVMNAIADFYFAGEPSSTQA